MGRFLFGARNGIHIIDLQHTVRAIDEADAILVHIVQNGGRVVFVGTKRQARDAVADAADKSGQFYVNQRWLGGTLTNFQTIKHRLERLRELRAQQADGAFELLSKRDMHTQVVQLQRLERKMGGLATMTELPDVVFLIDPNREQIAVNEARVLGIPVIAVVDSNCNPDEVDLPIPGNDDSIQAIRLILGRIADNVAEAFEQYETARIEREAAERIEHERQEQARREAAIKRQETEAKSQASDEVPTAGQKGRKIVREGNSGARKQAPAVDAPMKNANMTAVSPQSTPAKTKGDTRPKAASFAKSQSKPKEKRAGRGGAKATRSSKIASSQSGRGNDTTVDASNKGTGG
jgi:small subunit ribosomal protein S2